MENPQIARVFEEIADLLELQDGNPFRVRSYRNAARTIKDLSRPLAEMLRQGRNLTELSNIGESTSEKIEEILETGTCQKLEELKKGNPSQLTALLQVPALGAKKVKLIHHELGVETIEDLRKACCEHRVAKLSGMGEKTEENILKGIEILRRASGRATLKEARDQVQSLQRILESCKEVRQWQVAGSYRRAKETVGDLDILLESENRQATSDKILEQASVEEVVGRGSEKLSIRLIDGLQVDFRYFKKASFGAALLYFTGSKSHNIAIRKIATEKGWKLNEYGLFEDQTMLTGKSEEGIYKKLSLDWIPPELREDSGEVEAGQKGELPNLVEISDIQGDMHCHSTATDGQNTVREMAEAGRRRGYQYLAICDHSQAVHVAGGLDENGLQRQVEEIRKVDSEIDNFRLLSGVEVDIMKDGSLDLDPAVLADLDWVTASIHYNFNLSSEKMTARLLAAVQSGVVDCLGHPFARQIGRRQPLQFDVDKVFEACRENKVCLEINAQPERLDLLDIYCRNARDTGLKIVIDTDAHSVEELEFMIFGVGIARRGWLEKTDILNCLKIRQLEEYIKG